MALVILSVLVNVWGRNICRSKAETKVKTQLSTVVAKLSDASVSSYYDGIGTIEKIRLELSHMESVIGIRIWLVNSEGTVLADSAKSYDVPDIDAADYDKRILEQNISENVIISKVFNEPMLVCSEPFTYNYRAAGYICAFLPMSRMNKEASTYIEIMNVGMLIIFAVLFLIFAVIYLYTVIPIKTIRTAASEYAKGNYDYEMKIKSKDEILR